MKPAVFILVLTLYTIYSIADQRRLNSLPGESALQMDVATGE